MMGAQQEQKFLDEINVNMGILVKVSKMYAVDTTDAEDLKQEMLFHLWKSYDTFRGRSKFSTWMYRVCLNTAMTSIKKRKRYQPLTKFNEDQLQARSDSETTGQEKTSLLNRAIKKLSPVNKAIILLYFEDLSYDDIARITGFTKTNVSVRLVRIKKELEKELIKYKHLYYESE